MPAPHLLPKRFFLVCSCVKKNSLSPKKIIRFFSCSAGEGMRSVSYYLNHAQEATALCPRPLGTVLQETEHQASLQQPAAASNVKTLHPSPQPESLAAALERAEHRTEKSEIPIFKNQMIYSESSARTIPRPQPGWVKGSFSPVSSDLGAPPREAYATRAPNYSLQRTSNDVFGMPLGTTKIPSEHSSTHQDHSVPPRDAYVQRAPNYSLQRTSNDVFGVPLRNAKSPSQYSSTQQDLQAHQKNA